MFTRIMGTFTHNQVYMRRKQAADVDVNAYVNKWGVWQIPRQKPKETRSVYEPRLMRIYKVILTTGPCKVTLTGSQSKVNSFRQPNTAASEAKSQHNGSHLVSLSNMLSKSSDSSTGFFFTTAVTYLSCWLLYKNITHFDTLYWQHVTQLLMQCVIAANWFTIGWLIHTTSSALSARWRSRCRLFISAD